MSERILKIPSGLPASGKSTFAKEVVVNSGKYKRINFDLLREMLDCGVHSKANEKFVHQVAKAVAKLAFDGGYNVIMDNCNLSENQNNLNRAIADENKAEVQRVDSDVSVWECIDRDARRGDKSVGKKVIMDMWVRYIRTKTEAYPYDSSLGDCVIVDIDGTLAQNEGRSPYDMTRVYEDSVRNHVLTAVRGFVRDGYTVIFMSGRNEIGRAETIRWLRDRANIDFVYHLNMRKDGDNRADYIIKTELFNEHVRGKYNVAAVFDDRESVVRSWDSLGLGDRIFRVGRIHEDDF